MRLTMHGGGHGLAGRGPHGRSLVTGRGLVTAAVAALGHLELFEDVRHVDAHRFLGDEGDTGPSA